MGWLKAIQGFFSAVNAYFRASERKQNEEAGANKVDIANRKKADEVEKDADRVWDSKSRSRVRNVSPPRKE